MQETLKAIMLLQMPVIASIIVISWQAATVIKEFKYISIAWFINFIYIVISIFSKRAHLELNETALVTISDMSASYFFLLATIGTSEFKIFQKVKHPIILASVFLVAGFTKIFFQPQQDIFIPFVNEQGAITVFLDFISIFSLALFFKKVTKAFGGKKLLFFATLIYAIIQLINLFEIRSIGASLFFHGWLELIGFGLGFFSKFLILIGLMILVIQIFRKFTSAKNELVVKKAFSEKLNLILGRTYHELYPPLDEIDSHIYKLLTLPLESQGEYRLSKKTIEEIERIEAALYRAKTIVSASIEMYHSDRISLGEEDTTSGIPLPIEEKEDTQNVNTLIEIAVINFKAKIFKDNESNLNVTNKVQFQMEYGANCDIECNSVQMVQVFYNLFKNSYEACQNNDDKCQIFIKTKTLKQKNDSNISDERFQKFIQVEVEDNGPGIPDNISKKIYEVGFSTKSADYSKDRGFGLDIVKTYVELNNGTVYFESPVQEPRIKSNNVGTKFIITFNKA